MHQAIIGAIVFSLVVRGLPGVSEIVVLLPFLRIVETRLKGVLIAGVFEKQCPFSEILLHSLVWR